MRGSRPGFTEEEPGEKAACGQAGQEDSKEKGEVGFSRLPEGGEIGCGGHGRGAEGIDFDAGAMAIGEFLHGAEEFTRFLAEKKVDIRFDAHRSHGDGGTDHFVRSVADGKFVQFQFGMSLFVRIAEGIKILFVGREDQVVGRHEDLAGWRGDLPAFFHGMGTEVEPVAVIILSSAHDLLARFVAITAEEEQLIGFIGWADGGEEARGDGVSGEGDLCPLIQGVIVLQEVVVIAIGAIAPEEIETILAGIVKDVVVMSLVRKGIPADSVPSEAAVIQIEGGDGGLPFWDVEELIDIAFVLAAVDNTLAEDEVYRQLVGIGPCARMHGYRVEGDEAIPGEDEEVLIEGIKVEAGHLGRGFSVYGFPEIGAVDQPERVLDIAGEVSPAVVDAAAVPFVKREKMMFVVVAHFEIADGHIGHLGVVLVLTEDQVGRHTAVEAQAIGPIDHTVDADGDIVLIEIEGNFHFQPLVLLQGGRGDGNGQFIAFAVDIEIEATGAVVIEVTEAVGQVFIGQVEDIAEVGIVPEGEVEGDIAVTIKNGNLCVEDTVGGALGQQAILGFKLQPLGVRMQDR